jgi:hypothetical protein
VEVRPIGRFRHYSWQLTVDSWQLTVVGRMQF